MDSRLEERYIVVKRSDIPLTKELLFYALLQDYGIPTRDCVVVESDWPVYKDVVDMVLQHDLDKKKEYQASVREDNYKASCKLDS